MVCEVLPVGDRVAAVRSLGLRPAPTPAPAPAQRSETILPPTADEPDLIAAAQRDPAAFAPLYERYVDAIYRYSYRRLGNRDDAEDITAQTFQQALAALPGYQWRGAPFGAWLFRIAANLIARRGRAGRREIVLDDLASYRERRQAESRDDNPAELALQTADGDALVAAIRTLPLDQQRVAVLRFSRGLSHREIAARLGRSEGASKLLLHRALRALQARLLA
jgi:RNA polymerase sigma-70 factor (ECF subfamily)